ncbi:hypothetical protein [Kordiimonas aquimaris]|uniref:hypothetical protein n=1 Tax=Kordiimonas aquimaris TaxID=707591 RepID=UPI0021CE4725|nr:hypothetical protein [Kordiimonas aquimaris]
MVFTLTGSVGLLGDNRPHDVAKVQAAFKVLKASNGHAYFEGVVDGKINFFKPALQRFFQDHPVVGKSSRVFPRTIKKVGFLRNQIITKLNGHTLLNYQAIKGTSILYASDANHKSNIISPDYLILADYLPKKYCRIGSQAIEIHIEQVDFDLSESRYYSVISFPEIKAFVDAITLKDTALIPKQVHDLIEIFTAAGSNTWEVTRSDDLSGKIQLRIRSATHKGLARTLKEMDQNGNIGRVIQEDVIGRGIVLKIPPKDTIVQIAGRIHAQACAETGSEGGKIINKSLKSYAATILEKSLNKNFKNGTERHCASCRELAEDLKDSEARTIELIEQIEAVNLDFERFIKEQASAEDFDRAKQNLAKAGANLIPIIGDDLFQIDKTADEEILSKSKDLLSLYIEFAGRQKSVVASRILLRVNVLVAIFTLGVFIGQIGRYYIEKPMVDKKFAEVRTSILNIYLQLEAEDIFRLKTLRDFNARGCDKWLIY